MMLAIELAKLPPPKPERPATRSMTQNGVDGFATHAARPSVGMSSSSAETMVQLRPPKRETVNVYGIRRVAPMRLGIEMSQNVCDVSNLKPAAGSWTVVLLGKSGHNCDITRESTTYQCADAIRLHATCGDARKVEVLLVEHDGRPYFTDCELGTTGDMATCTQFLTTLRF